MPPELFTAIQQWGFPAFLVVYALWRFDQTVLPALLKHLESLEAMVKAVQTNSDDMKATKAAAERTEVAVINLGEVLHEGFTRVLDKAS
jgi:hypothetical protein